MGHKNDGRKKKGAVEQPSAKAPTMLDRGHRVNDTASFFTACGARRTGWTYGTETDVTCVTCMEV